MNQNVEIRAFRCWVYDEYGFPPFYIVAEAFSADEAARRVQKYLDDGPHAGLSVERVAPADPTDAINCLDAEAAWRDCRE